jgi:drug/metabolite transporter (DMT)-like permease
MKAKIWVALIAIYLIWGSTYLGMRFAVETIPPFLMTGTRFLSAGLMLYTWRRLSGDPAPSLAQWRSTATAGVLMLLLGTGVVSWSEQYVDSGVTSLLVASAPLFMVIIDALRPGGTKPGALAIVGLLIGLGGIGLLVGPSLLHVHLENRAGLGLIMLLIASFWWALGSVVSRYGNHPDSPLLGSGMQMLAGGVGLVIVSGLLGEWRGFDPASVSTRSLSGYLYLIFVGSLGGFVSYAWLLRNAPLSLVGTYAYVNPLVAVMLGAWLAGETLTPRILVAAAIIIGSVMLINRARQKESRSAKMVPAAERN